MEINQVKDGALFELDLPELEWLDSDRRAAVMLIIRGIIKPDWLPQTRQFIRDCYYYPDEVSILMSALNEICETHGVEVLSPPGWDNLNHPKFSYLNTGDAYTATIIYDHDQDLIFICSWGDIAESFQYEDEEARSIQTPDELAHQFPTKR